MTLLWQNADHMKARRALVNQAVPASKSNDALSASGPRDVATHRGALSLLPLLFEDLFKDAAAWPPEVSLQTIDMRAKGNFDIPPSCLMDQWKKLYRRHQSKKGVTENNSTHTSSAFVHSLTARPRRWRRRGAVNIAVYAEVDVFEKKISACGFGRTWITGTRYTLSRAARSGAGVWQLAADSPHEIYDVPDRYRL